jgi:nitroreductase
MNLRVVYGFTLSPVTCGQSALAERSERALSFVKPCLYVMADGLIPKDGAMDTFEAIRTLRAVRAFRHEPVPDETVRRIVEAGRLTASAGNRQQWHFIVVRDKDMLRQLGALMSTGPYIAHAPLAVVVVIPKGEFPISDGSRAIQSMLIAAWSEGVGSNWVGFNVEAVKAPLGIPDDLTVLAILPFGYPAGRITGENKKRKPLGEVASSERFGQPFK